MIPLLRKFTNLNPLRLQLLEMNIEQIIQLAFEYYQAGQFIKAEEYLKKAIAFQPGNAELYNNLGLVLQGMGKIKEAVEYFQKAISLEPNLADAYYNLANICREIGDIDKAIIYYQKATQLDNENYDAYVNLGIALKETGNLDEAIHSYQKALKLNPESADAYVNLSIAMKEKGHLQEAINFCKKALNLDPENPYAFINMGNALLLQGKLEDAEECFRNALIKNPSFSIAYSNLLCSLNYNLKYNEEMIFLEHKRFSERFEKNKSYKIFEKKYKDKLEKLKIGYVSPDFRQHSVFYFIESVLSAHNHERFEIFCYSNVSAVDDKTRYIQQYADHWKSIVGMSDELVTQIIQQDGIDILIDLAGHTAGNRILLFAHKTTPLQISWIGYPATTGLSTIDYKIVDSHTDPPGKTEQYFTEKLLRMKDCFLCYTPDRDAPSVSLLPALTQRHITFGSFNNFAKINMDVVRIWSRILKVVDESHLVLKAFSFLDDETRNNAMKMFSDEGIEEGRVELLPPLPSIREHLNVYSRIDIALDTFPYNGTTTTCEALWMGVPVITLAGKSYAGRVGGSLLTNVGLKDCIAYSEEEYVEIAVKMAEDIQRLQDLRFSLRDMMKGSPLMDAKVFTLSLERCFEEIWQTWCNKIKS